MHNFLMRGITNKISLMLCLLSAFCVKQTIYAQGTPKDFELWKSVTISKEFNDKWSMSFSDRLRLDENASQFKSNILLFGASYEVVKHWKITGGARYTLRGRTNEYRFYMDNSYNYKIPKSALSVDGRFRVQMDRKFDPSKPTDIATRLRLRLQYAPSKLKDWKFTLLSAEGFYQWSDPTTAGLYRTRLSAGCSYELSNSKTISVHYVHQASPLDASEEIDHVLQLELSIGFPYKKKSDKKKSDSSKQKNGNTTNDAAAPATEGQ